MADKELKSKVLRLFLEFIQKYVPLDEAMVASLGGEGREARIWQEVGITGSNGWLVERNRKLSQKLIAESPYRITASLGKFSRAFRSVAGSSRGVDAFHLDLRGTLEPNVDITRRIIPMVVKSQGRCFAITVADARRNLAVENFEKIESWLSALLGFRYQRMRQKLEAEQREDRDLAIMREIGLFFSVNDLFRFYGRYAVPDRVRRFAYISHTSGKPFPMRTYFFHFTDKPERMVEPQFAKVLYGLWFREPLHDLNRPPQERVRTKEMPDMSMQKHADDLAKLKKMADVMDLGSAFDKLVAAANSALLIEELKALIQRFDGGGSVPADPGADSPKPRPRAAKGAQNGERVAAQIELLNAKVKGQKAYDKARIEIGSRFKGPGRASKLKAARVSRALFAQTQKTKRPAFLQRLAKHDAALINDDLAMCYTKLTGKEVTLEQLRGEAGL